MSGRWSRVNLRELPDSGGDGLESRFGRRPLETEHLGVSYFRYSPGFHVVTGHTHRSQEEVYVVVGGSGRLRLDDDLIELGLWDAVRVAPGVLRGLEGGPEGLEVIAVASDRPPEGDVEHAQDWWPR
jgi:mannose-6-phosphate isomerase-like protein (cupin superfamily)